MNKLKRILFSEVTIVCLLTLIVFFISFYYLFYYTSIAPAGTVFPLIHNHNFDYNFYLSLIRQSLEGRWLFITRFSPEVFPPRFVYFTFLLLGKAAQITHLDLTHVYLLSRLVFGITFIYLIYLLIRLTFSKRKERLLAFFLTLFGTGFWTLTRGANGELIINRFLNFWTEIDFLERFVYLPHHLLGKVLMIGALIALYQSIILKRKKLLVLAIITGFLSGLSSPYALANLELTLTITLVLSAILFGKDKSMLVRIISNILLFIVFSSLSLVYLRIIEQGTYPWNNYLGWEKVDFPISATHLIYSLGPNFIFTLIALPHLLKTKRLIYIILISWILTPWFGIFVLSRLSLLSNVRFLSSSYFIPLGILGSIGIGIASAKLSQFFKLNRHLILILLLIILTFIFAIDIRTSLAGQLKSFSPNHYNIFIPKSVLSSFQFLSTSTPADSVVLSQGFMGNLIPAYSHNKTVRGHPNASYNYDQKDGEIGRFFSQEDINFSRNLLNKYKVEYVFFSLDTPPPNEKFLNDLGLERIFGNEAVNIFK